MPVTSRMIATATHITILSRLPRASVAPGRGTRCRGDAVRFVGAGLVDIDDGVVSAATGQHLFDGARHGVVLLRHRAEHL